MSVQVADRPFLASEYAITAEHDGWVLWRRPPSGGAWMAVDATNRDDVECRWRDRIRLAWGTLIRWRYPGPPHGGAR